MFIKGLLNLVMSLLSLKASEGGNRLMCEELVYQCLCTSSFMGCIDPFLKKNGGIPQAYCTMEPLARQKEDYFSILPHWEH